MDEILIWLLIVEILGIIGFPIAFLFCNNLTDRGYSISKILGILLVCYLTWISTSLGVLGYTTLSIILAIILVTILSLHIVNKNKAGIRDFLRDNKKTIIINEVVFLIVFLLFLTIRMHTPDIQTLEKFMDISFINGIDRSVTMPPIDPWFSGGHVQYYYFGYFIIVTLSKLACIPTYISYNLAIALFFSLLAVAAFGIGYNLTKKYFYGILTIVFICILGNSFGFLQLLVFINPGLTDTLADNLMLQYPLTCCWNPSMPLSKLLQSFPIWSSTRIIPDTINEFPYATFIFGDLHPHYMGFPFQVFILILFLNIFYSSDGRFFGDSIPTIAFRVLLLSLSLGSLFFINSWDYPTYVFLFMALIILRRIQIDGKLKIRSLLTVIVSIVVIVSLSLLFYLPYHADNPASRAVDQVKDSTAIQHFLIIFILFLYLIFAFLIYLRYQDRKEVRIISLSNIAPLFMLLGVLFFIYPWIVDIQIIIILVPLAYLVVPKLLNKEQPTTFILILILMGTLLAMFCEIFHIDSRLNTVFKFYMEMWFLWAISAAYAVYYLRERFSPRNIFKSRLNIFLIAALCLLLLACSITPVLVTYKHLLIGSKNHVTLDGLEYMKKNHPGDFHAIKWMNENIRGQKIIIEKPGDAYTYDSRVSANTGLPTVIGWLNHEFIWRQNWFHDRANDVHRIFNTLDNNLSLALLKKYNVSYIYVGSLEWQKYKPQGLTKFADYPEYYTEVYNNLNTRIYRVDLSNVDENIAIKMDEGEYIKQYQSKILKGKNFRMLDLSEIANVHHSDPLHVCTEDSGFKCRWPPTGTTEDILIYFDIPFRFVTGVKDMFQSGGCSGFNPLNLVINNKVSGVYWIMNTAWTTEKCVTARITYQDGSIREYSPPFLYNPSSMYHQKQKVIDDDTAEGSPAIRCDINPINKNYVYFVPVDETKTLKSIKIERADRSIMLIYAITTRAPVGRL